MRLEGRKLADIGKELLDRSLVEAGVGGGVLVSAISKVARTLIGDELADVIATETRNPGRGGRGRRAENVPVPEASAAGAKARGFQVWEFEQDRLLKETVAACTKDGATDWEDVSWILERQYGIRSSAHGCRLRYGKAHRALPPDEPERADDEVMSYKIDDYR
jgi:hypothetical protein